MDKDKILDGVGVGEENLAMNENLVILEELTNRLTSSPMRKVYEIEGGECVAHFLAAAEDYSILKFEMRAGTKFQLHKHDVHEWVILLDGEAVAESEGEITPLSAGESVDFPRGVPHTFEAITDVTGLALLFRQRGGILMENGNTNDWGSWSKYVLKELKRMNDQIERMEDRLRQIEQSIVILQQKAGVWGMIGGAVPAAVVIAWMILKG